MASARPREHRSVSMSVNCPTAPAQPTSLLIQMVLACSRCRRSLLSTVSCTSISISGRSHVLCSSRFFISSQSSRRSGHSSSPSLGCSVLREPLPARNCSIIPHDFPASFCILCRIFRHYLSIFHAISVISSQKAGRRRVSGGLPACALPVSGRLYEISSSLHAPCAPKMRHRPGISREKNALRSAAQRSGSVSTEVIKIGAYRL